MSVTVFPSFPIPLPKIRVRDFEHVTTSSGHWFLLGEVLREVDLPVDSYLPGRELDLAIERRAHDDMAGALEAVIRFCREWGVPYDPDNRDFPSAETFAGYMNTDDSLEAQMKVLFELGLISVPESGELQSRESTAEWVILTRRLIPCDRILARFYGARSIRDLSDHFLGNARIGVSELDFNGFLAPFGRRIELGTEPSLEPTVFNVMALQLSNDILEDVPVRTCASETCGRPFTRQRDGRGRIDFPTNRVGGVKYCSRSCATAQGKRESRRRLKATTNKGETK